MKVVHFTTHTTEWMDKYSSRFAEEHIEYEKVYDAKTEAEILEGAKGADVIATSVVRFPASVIEKLDRSVKCIIRTADGYEIIDVEAATKRGIMVCNIPDYNVEEVATHTVTLMLACNDYTVQYDKLVRKGKWTKMGWVAYPNVKRFSEITVGLIGFGKIGRPTARNLSGFGCKICAYDPYLPDEIFEQMNVERMGLDELLRESDIISLHTPLFETTRNIINSESIAKMKDGVVIINTSRGELIDNEALIAGLKTGKVKAAGLGTHVAEPIHDPQNPFFKLENVILTPHTASYSLDAREQLRRESVEISITAAKGGMPYSCVNREALESREKA